MKNMLETIVAQKRVEVAELSKNPSYRNALKEEKPVSNIMKKALKGDRLAIIAEIKKRSPSVGEINSKLEPLSQALLYQKGGAAAISILTDRQFFGGSLDDLNCIRKEMVAFPILRKDFIIDPLQIAEASLAKVSAILLIVAILGSSTGLLLREARRMGLEAVVEVHDDEELKMAVDAGAEIIGVNCRNLKTFEIDRGVTETLISHIPNSIIKIAESGIRNVEDALQVKQLGYDAVLIGETLVRSADPSALIKAMRC